MGFRKYYTDTQFIDAVNNNVSARGVLKELGLIPAGGNYFTVNRKIAKLNLDTSHFTGKLWNKDKRIKNWDDFKSNYSMKLQLIKEFGHKCGNCGLSVWFGKPIVLEMHHIDGDASNNNLENVELLCPNCHSFTKTWRRQKTTSRKNIERVKSNNKYYCPVCGAEKARVGNLCVKCANISKRKVVNRPEKATLLEEVKLLGFVKTGQKYGVSDNAIRKWLR